jgi:DNA-binding transcriptional LysR family regulator
LLNRTTRSVALTNAGERYLVRARAIVESVRDAEAAARAERSTPSGHFVVSAPLVFGRREVAPLFSEYLARYPAVTGELVLSDRMMSLVDEGVDATVRIGALEDSSLKVRVVGAVRRVLVASPDYLAGRKRIRKPADLRDHATIQLIPIQPVPEWRFFRDKRRERVPIRPVLVTNSADAAITHAQRGLGVALVFSYQIRDLVHAGELAVVLPKYEPPVIPISVAYPGAREASANVRAFIELTLATRSWKFVDV